MSQTDPRRAALLLLGPTGSGKTPLGRKLKEKGWRSQRCVHFDFGAELRSITAAPEAAANLYAKDVEIVRNSLATGALLEDDEFPIALQILHVFISRQKLTPGDFVILNGLPRHVGQARMLESRLHIQDLIVMEAPAEVILARVRLNTGGDRTGRQDDTLEAVRDRLEIYRRRTLPLIAFYESRGVRLFRMAVTTDMTDDEMYRHFVAATNEEKGQR